jgi:hypothetical protein
VIFDEVHYVNDADRGVVWEEVRAPSTSPLPPLSLMLLFLLLNGHALFQL